VPASPASAPSFVCWLVRRRHQHVVKVSLPPAPHHVSPHLRQPGHLRRQGLRHRNVAVSVPIPPTCSFQNTFLTALGTARRAVGTMSVAPNHATPRIFRLDGDASLKAELAPFCPQGNVGKALAKRRAGLAVDVGAYDGADTISYATAGHEVFSFEASPKKARGIMELVNASGVAERVSFWSAALSDHEGTTSFWQFPAAVGHSLARGNERDSIASEPFLDIVPLSQINTTGLNKLQRRKSAQKMRLLSPKNVTVPLLTLDGVMGSRTALFVKIDAQGHDGLVILGGRALISERRAHILRFELSPFLEPKQTASYLPAIELQLVQSWRRHGGSLGLAPATGSGHGVPLGCLLWWGRSCAGARYAAPPPLVQAGAAGASRLRLPRLQPKLGAKAGRIGKSQGRLARWRRGHAVCTADRRPAVPGNVHQGSEPLLDRRGVPAKPKVTALRLCTNPSETQWGRNSRHQLGPRNNAKFVFFC
jgi:FkbM family methyltransferase